MGLTGRRSRADWEEWGWLGGEVGLTGSSSSADWEEEEDPTPSWKADGHVLSSPNHTAQILPHICHATHTQRTTIISVCPIQQCALGFRLFTYWLTAVWPITWQEHSPLGSRTKQEVRGTLYGPTPCQLSVLSFTLVKTQRQDATVSLCQTMTSQRGLKCIFLQSSMSYNPKS